MALHAGEFEVDEHTVRALLAAQRPEFAEVPIRFAGGGTDNSMFRIGDELVARLPRTPEKVASLLTELAWLPRLAGHLPCRIPEPVHAGAPAAGYPAPWALYSWIDGTDVSPDSVDDWERYGRDLAAVVAALRATALTGASRDGDLAGYRGGPLAPHDSWVRECFDAVRPLETGLDLSRLEQIWRDALARGESRADHVWLHTDLRPGNVLARNGRLHAVIDFGSLTVGAPDAEHAVVWDLPPAARVAYRTALGVDDDEWTRARGWAVAVGISGAAYYWHSFPAFVDECLARLRALCEPE